MRVIMFQERFALKVADGTKKQTIRKSPRCKPGDTLSLRHWTGKPYRSKQDVLRTSECLAVHPLWIGETQTAINGYYLEASDEQRLSEADGFANMEDMRDWFRAVHGLPFTGYVILWSNTSREAR